MILAEGQAEEKLIIEVKAAEAQERKARHKATEETTLADARLKVAEKEAEAKKREAEGLEALTAAPGLAAAKVTMVTADAGGEAGHGRCACARGRCRSHAQGRPGRGAGDRTALAGRGRGRARQDGGRGQRQREAGPGRGGRVRLADADAVVKAGQADAATIEARFQAEAKGLREKFEAMSAMSGETRAHEEFRMQLEMAHVETVKGIDAQTSIARRAGRGAGCCHGQRQDRHRGWSR